MVTEDVQVAANGWITGRRFGVETGRLYVPICPLWTGHRRIYVCYVQIPHFSKHSVCPLKGGHT